MFTRKARAKNQADESRVKKAYARLGRLAHTTATPFLKIYHRDKHVRVRALILNDDQEILLVRSWFSHQKWSLPGGGIRGNETPAEAAVREVHEETGLRIDIEDLHEMGSFPHPNPKQHFMVACYKVQIPKRPPRLAHHRRLEMLDVSWFPLAHLPHQRGALVDLAISLLT